jgi:DNA-binding response OmpR family regulator
MNETHDAGRAARILVVDDEPDMLDLLVMAMTSLRDCTVTAAKSAEEALAHVSAAPGAFDVALLDVQMPDVGGLELLERLRDLPGFEGTPVLMLTAVSDRVHVEEAYRQGARDYIKKPFDYDDLLARIDAVIGDMRPPGGRAPGGDGGRCRDAAFGAGS